jgi:hypothetical protein
MHRFMHSALGFPFIVKRKVKFKEPSTPIKNNFHQKSPIAAKDNIHLSSNS